MVKNWLNSYGLNDYITGITNQKIAAWLIIDDRCITFSGNYDILLNQIENFKPWYK